MRDGDFIFFLVLMAALYFLVSTVPDCMHKETCLSQNPPEECSHLFEE